MEKPKSDRMVWIVTRPCGCPTAVSEGDSASTAGAVLDDIYYTNKKLADAVRAGITARPITFEEYKADYYKKMLPEYLCPH